MKVKEEINKMAPSLHNYVKKDGFIIPDMYFERLQHEVSKKLGIHLKVEDFEVPNHYFENLPDIVISQLNDQNKIHIGAKVVKLGFLKKVASIAATILILVFAGHYVYNLTPDTSDDISNEMLIVLIDEYFNDLKLNNLMDQDILKEDWFFSEMEINDDEWVTFMDSEYFDESDILMIDY